MFFPWLYRELSIDDFVDDDAQTRLAERMKDREAANAEEELLRQEMIQLTRDALSELPERQRIILMRRFGFLGQDEMTLEAIGGLLGLSRERVRQLECEAKVKLRETVQQRMFHRLIA
ncbi:MAG: sigma-70 family RNA polymerase sigma factor [Acidobacteriota bacterium]|nr:MAG: sigma-70 family RNA polymerase sigma factor [Acidobacteriota bacterium]